MTTVIANGQVVRQALGKLLNRKQPLTVAEVDGQLHQTEQDKAAIKRRISELDAALIQQYAGADSIDNDTEAELVKLNAALRTAEGAEKALQDERGAAVLRELYAGHAAKADELVTAVNVLNAIDDQWAEAKRKEQALYQQSVTERARIRLLQLALTHSRSDAINNAPLEQRETIAAGLTAAEASAEAVLHTTYNNVPLLSEDKPTW